MTDTPPTQTAPVVKPITSWRELDDKRLKAALDAFYDTTPHGTTVDGVRDAIIAWENSRSSVEPVAWRWRPVGSSSWIYNPDIDWLEAQGEAVEKEPLYAAPTSSREYERYSVAHDALQSLGERYGVEAGEDRVAGIGRVLESQLAIIRQWVECARYDVKMSGPVRMGWDLSALERALTAGRALLSQTEKG